MFSCLSAQITNEQQTHPIARLKVDPGLIGVHSLCIVRHNRGRQLAGVTDDRGGQGEVAQSQDGGVHRLVLLVHAVAVLHEGERGNWGDKNCR